MRKIMSESQLHEEAGRTAAEQSFRPAFLDYTTCTVYMSRFSDGRLAPIHLLDGVPHHVVAKGTLISGFERGGFFYTRRMVAKACGEWRI